MVRGLTSLTALLPIGLLCLVPQISLATTLEVLGSGPGSVVLTAGFEPPELHSSEVDGRTYDTVWFEGCGWVREEGHPRLPVRGMLVGIPFGVSPQIRVLDVEIGGRLDGLNIAPAPRYEPFRDALDMGHLLPVLEPDPDVYARGSAYPAGWVEIGRTATLRFQNVLQVCVFPLRWEPATGTGTWVKRITFEVRWDEASRKRELGRAPEEPLWEGMYRRLIVNHEAARLWRGSPLPPHPSKSPVVREGEFKLIIPETGIYEVRYEDLSGIGGPIPADDIGVYQKVYAEGGSLPWEETPVPIHLVDDDGDSFFGAGDRLYFWALDFRDAYVEFGYEDRYATENVYWLGWGSAGGARMEVATLWHGTADDTVSSSRYVQHFEEEVYYDAAPSGPDRDGLPPECDMEQFFWTDWRSDYVSLPVEVYDPDPADSAVVRARYQGRLFGTHYVRPRLTNAASLSFWFSQFSILDQSEYVFDSGAVVPGSFLSNGTNYYVHEGYSKTDLDGKGRIGVHLDWVELAYDRLLRARDDYLDFNSGERSGGFAFVVEAFSDSEILLFDVRDPRNEKVVTLPAEAVRTGGGEYQLVFSDSVGPDSLGEAGRWVAVASGGAMRLEEDEILRDPAGLLCESEGDYVMISHPLFLDGIQDLAGYREAQGFRAQVTDVTDVYDEFNGGIKDPIAIKRYLQWAFEHWTVKPQFAVLVGDASEDNNGHLAESGPDFVPTMSLYKYGELEAMDNWFVRFNDDFLLDIYLGRLSVGSEAELEAVVDKIFAYEQFSPDDAWRGRVLAMSDDQCSSSEHIEYHCGISSELEFMRATESAAELARASVGAALQVREIHLAEYTDGYHDLCFTAPATFPLPCIQDSVYDNVTPVLFDALNEGVLLFSFQGHGNRKVIFHEYVLADSVTFNQAWRSDLRRSANNGMPYITHGFGCHFADFNEPGEDDYHQQESLLEKMTLIPGGGAVAALGSTGYEAINTNSAYETQFYRALFDNPPTVMEPGGAEHARWVLGEVQAAAVSNLAANGYGGSFLNRYVLLGDPALRMDALPPRLLVTVDGVEVEDGGFIAAGDSSVVRIMIEVGDETAIDSTSISLGILRDGDLVTLAARQDYSVKRDTTTYSDARLLTIDYPHEIQLPDYDIVFSAEDWNGRPVSFVLKVRFAFRAWFDGRLADDGSRALPDANVVLEVGFPRVVSEEDLAVKLAGLLGTQEVQAQKEMLDETGMEWRISFSLDHAEPGVYRILVAFGPLEQEMMSFEVASRLEIESVLAYPSPFERWTQFSFVLSKPAAVRIQIFTVFGRLIRTLEHSGVVDYHNYVQWDGLDEDGDSVANGVYLYQITATSGEEAVKSEIGKVVRMK